MTRKLQIIGLTLILVCLLSAFTCNAEKQQQVAQAAQDASTVVKGFQQGEILAYQQGQIPEADHQFIQQSLKTLAVAGKKTDACIQGATNDAGVVSCLNGSISTIDNLNTEGALYLKSDKAKLDFALAMVGTRTALGVITTILGGK